MKHLTNTKVFAAIIILLVIPYSVFSSEKNKNISHIQTWLSDPANNILFTKQKQTIQFKKKAEEFETITIKPDESYQSIDGFGFCLTGGSARLLNEMNAQKRNAILNELYSTDGENIGSNYLRLSIGASDLSDSVFTYNDLPAGETDVLLEKFSIDMEKVHLIPVLKEILAISPNIPIMGSPWTPPVWMKDNKNSIGGSLLPEYYDAYALYFVKYIQAMEAEGIKIDAITIQNEPLHPGNNPSLLMKAEQQAEFIKQSLGPIFRKHNIETKIVIYDHNADRPDYPITILNDPDAKQYLDGSAFHLYGGKIEALSEVHNAHPDKNIYFTEQWVGEPGDLAGDLMWHTRNLTIGATRNWSRNVLEWNLAADPDQNPHTPGGCTRCLGAITIDGNKVTRNPAYYIIAHASKFVRKNAVRVESNLIQNLDNVAFKNTDGTMVLIVANSSSEKKYFNIEYKDKTAQVMLNAGAVATYVW
jgi:glucosylceramidase